MQLNTINIYLIIAFAFSVSIQLFYYFFFYFRLLKSKKTNISINNEQPPVTVIICAKNEDENLKNFIPLIAEQNYPNFEIIVVNDGSYDDTEFILDFLEKKHKNLRHTTIPENKFKHGKKLALSIGIKSAKNEHLILTDADCYPASKDWIKNIVKNYTPEKDIVISYGAFEKEKTFINKLIRYDNFYNSINFLSFAKAKIPYMGTGRNLSYKKSLFIKNKGFSSHYNILSGDDDLFISETATKNNVSILTDYNNFTFSIPKKTFKEWFYQKTRHIHTSVKYKFIHKILLALEPLNRIAFYSLLTISIIFQCKLVILLSIFIIVFKLFSSYLLLKALKEKELLLISLLYDFISPWLYFLIHLRKKISKQQW